MRIILLSGFLMQLFCGTYSAINKNPDKFLYRKLAVKESLCFMEKVQDSSYKIFEKIVLESIINKNINYTQTMTNSKHQRFIIIQNKRITEILSNDAYPAKYYKQLFLNKYDSELDWKINLLLYSKFRISNFEIVPLIGMEGLWREKYKASDKAFWKKYLDAF